MGKWLCIVLLVFLPHIAGAAVTISEIAWMGDSVSANNEWIELYNDGASAVSLDGWKLSDGGNLNIQLVGTVSAGSYVLLERNRASASYLKNPPFLTYTGAMVNTGATLTLYRSDNSVEDRVAGGENWSIGGDNTTKDTAQHTTNGWITAKSTPGSVNAQVGTTPPTNTGTSTSTSSTTGTNSSTTTNTANTPNTSSGSGTKAASSANSQTVRFLLPPNSLRLSLDIQSTGYVNQMIPFGVVPSGIGDDLKASLKYDWNFGDISTSSFKNPFHIYQYPGTYVVTLKATVGRQIAIVRHEITILPTTFSITRNSKQDIQINNDSPYEVDLSGYSLAGNYGRTFPPRTILLAKNTITIPYQKIANNPNTGVALYDAQNELVTATWMKKTTIGDVSGAEVVSGDGAVPESGAAALVLDNTDDNFVFVSDMLATSSTAVETELVDSAIETESEIISIGGNEASVSRADSIDQTKLAYLAMVGLLLLAILGLVFSKK